ncbi:AIPR family protein [Streptomyces sp. DSM 110735]|uniref:AIPR family protein n=1 Tax=Streptomyces sp. DSM 110735 TaxID=2775031 RepID=UPI0018F7CC64|nr:AIPR family protein [Streptomyces sp. DSM 110735]MBJ7902497.1 AIPR family protein [Streptomyces sp. DSM 110735]
MSKFHVSQIETHIRALHETSNWKSSLEEVNNLSRILALHSVHLVLGPSEGLQPLIEITDGAQDRGIDAIGVDPTAKLVVFVQSKWRQDGSGSMALGDVLKFLQGVRSLLGMRADDDLAHASEKTKTAVRDLLKTPGARIRLVTVTTAGDSLTPDVQDPIVELLNQLNDLEGIEPLATHTHFAQADLFNSISEQARPAVDIELQMLDWGRASEPQRMYYGRVSAAEIAGWFRDFGVDLFAENIRVVIPRSDINDGILQTIRDDPERFAYYNNGITVLAEAIEIGPGGALNRDVGFFKLSGASIVNGAQTVSTLGSALATEHEKNLGSTFVLVRCIEVPKDEDELGRRITRFANTQNEVSSQDFAFLDQEQHRLVRELQVLGYEYLLRSAEQPKSKDPEKVIEVRQAAVALACASKSVNHSVIAKREVSRLFSEPSVYRSLFNSGTDPLRLTRAVRITASVDRWLDKIERERDGAEAGIAVHGRRVIAHLVMRKLGDNFLKDPESNLDAVMDGLESEVNGYIADMVLAFPANAYPGNVFKNQARVAALIRDARRT